MARRAHRKSKTGCKRCKKRRVKCDEIHPSCGNCTRIGLPCDFLPEIEWIKATTASPSASTISNHIRRGRPLKDHIHSVDSTRTKPPKISFSLPTRYSENDDFPPTSLDVYDIELFHHYMINTESCLGCTSSKAHMFRVEVPRLGYQFHGITYLVLGISAQNLASGNPEERTRYRELAEKNFEKGIKHALDLTMQFNESNCQAAWISALLVIIYVLSKGPEPGNYLLFTYNQTIDFWSLVRGVRNIINITGLEKLFTGPLAAFQYPPDYSEDLGAATGKLKGLSNWELTLRRLKSHLTEVSETDRCISCCIEAVDKLCPFFQSMCGSSGKAPGITPGSIMFWCYGLDGKFSQSLQEKRIPALVVLAHFCPLLCLFDGQWHLKDWARHILSGILDAANVSGRVWLDWLDWPTKCVEEARGGTS